MDNLYCMGYICSPYLLTKSANQNSHQMAKTKIKPEIKVRIKKDLKTMNAISVALDGKSFYTIKRRLDRDDPAMTSIDVLTVISRSLGIPKSELTH